MKKILFSIIMLITFAPTFAAEVIVTSDKPIKSVKSQNPKIVKVSLIPTIFNDRNTMLLEILDLGSTGIIVTTAEKEEYIGLNSLQTRYILFLPEGFQQFELDKPIEPLEILPPPDPNKFPDILRGRM